MAAVFLTCCGILSTRMEKKRKDRQEREKDYSEHFEELKAANAARVRQLSDAAVQGYNGMPPSTSSLARHSRGGSVESHGVATLREEGVERGDHLCELRTPPSYEDVVVAAGARRDGVR